MNWYEMPLTKSCYKRYLTPGKPVITKEVSNNVIPRRRWAPTLFTTLSVVSDKDLIVTNLSKEGISWLCSWDVTGTAYRIKESCRNQGSGLGCGIQPLQDSVKKKSPRAGIKNIKEKKISPPTAPNTHTHTHTHNDLISLPYEESMNHPIY